MTDHRKPHVHPTGDSSSAPRSDRRREDSGSAPSEEKTYKQRLAEFIGPKGLKMREVAKQGGTDYIVYTDVKDQDFKEVFAWVYADNDPEEQEAAFREALAVLHTTHQDVKKPLETAGKYSDQVAELRYFARKHGFNIAWHLREKHGIFEHRFGVIKEATKETKEERKVTAFFKSESEATDAAIKLVESGCAAAGHEVTFVSSSHAAAKEIAAKAKKDVAEGKIQVVKRKKADDNPTQDTKRRRNGGGNGDRK
ncbi:uncharacterized protein FOMMEDRAFT_159028 [Fomitiporia mediterranea MF3/22]|uniref:uncharacterized protein n=1 Tax=Fomitiporia mediterranea (strain MF3/22) TaxID=694068 RepID=UPI0004408FE1|nr:uncharacterized protein FOMMEDRAFT_159028 [Fomitiporia mediterranea MF3/22]EJD00355.1 hypothetical protein FOMMEDRAFT_159028 [Fomitiporia mediterranea MF3/22]